jgi:hypothetical protein
MTDQTPQPRRNYALVALIVLYTDQAGVQHQHPMNLMTDISVGYLGLAGISMLQSAATTQALEQLPDKEITVTNVVITSLIPMGNLTLHELRHNPFQSKLHS